MDKDDPINVEVSEVSQQAAQVSHYWYENLVGDFLLVQHLGLQWLEGNQENLNAQIHGGS